MTLHFIYSTITISDYTHQNIFQEQELNVKHAAVEEVEEGVEEVCYQFFHNFTCDFRNIITLSKL